MQADVILKEPPSWVPPLSLSGGASVEGAGGGRGPPRTPLGDDGLVVVQFHMPWLWDWDSKEGYKFFKNCT